MQQHQETLISTHNVDCSIQQPWKQAFLSAATSDLLSLSPSPFSSLLFPLSLSIIGTIQIITVSIFPLHIINTALVASLNGENKYNKHALGKCNLINVTYD